MSTLTEAIQKLKNALKNVNINIELKEDYGFLTEDSNLDSQWAFTIVGIANDYNRSFDEIKRSVSNDDLYHLEKYPANALKAAWNVATILGNINVESSWPKIGTAQTILKVANKGSNRKQNSTNLLSSLDYLDASNNNGVPHIIDDVTYKINLAINQFITEMALIPQGKNLIKLSEQLGSLSFSNMQKAAQERIATYDKYLKLHKSTVPEERGTNEHEEELFFDALEGPIPEEDDDELEFHDAVEEPARKDDDTNEAKTKTVQLFQAFAKQVSGKLNSRILDNPNDYEQINRCLNAIKLIEEMGDNISLDKTFDSIQSYLSEKEKEINNTFSENRSQTWFRKYISEPFKFFKTAVNNCFKACGFKEPFVNDTVKKFVQFKELFDRILSEEKMLSTNEEAVSQKNH